MFGLLRILKIIWVEIKSISKKFKYTLWATNKNLAIHFRKYLSRYAALFLALATVIREIFEHDRIEDIFNQLFSILLHPFSLHNLAKVAIIQEHLVVIWNKFLMSDPKERWVILAIAALTLLTIGAACWEQLGAKLDVSEQERRFAVGIKNLLSEFEKYRYNIEKSPPEEIEDLLTEFIDNVLRTASNTLCGSKLVHAGMITYYPSENSLKLTRFTEASGYDPSLIIDLNDEKKQKGPAQTAFDNDAISHMPNKNRTFGWYYEEKAEENYDFKDFIEGWVEPPPANSTVFKSVISFPVSNYAGKNTDGEKQKNFYGVVNFTSTKDHFIPRDFSMASSFTSLIAQAFDMAKTQSEKRSQNK